MSQFVRRISELCWYEICCGTTREMCVYGCLKIEQKFSLWLYLLQHSGCAQGLAYSFLWSHFFFFLTFWSRWVGTGSQMYFSQVCQCERRMIASENCCVCGGWDKGTCSVATTTLGPSRFMFCLVLFWRDIYTGLFSPSVPRARVEVLTPQLLCLAAVWLSGLFFLPLLD